MRMQKIVMTTLVELSALQSFAQQWVLDEIADEQRETGSDSTPIPGIFFFGLIIFLVYLWDQHKKDKEERKEHFLQKQKEEEQQAKARKEREVKAKVIAKEKLQEKNYIDLGLSVKWADRNLFAKCDSDKGAMFAWGDNERKTEHNSSGACLNNKYGIALANAIGNDKRCICGNNSFDPAVNNWGGYWRLPQTSEIKELLWHCEWTWECKDNVYGYKVTGKNGNSIFLPITGQQVGKEQIELEKGFYWSGFGSSNPGFANCMIFMDKWHVDEDIQRWHGCAVRPVWAEPQPSREDIIVSINQNVEKWNNLSSNQKYETYKHSFKITEKSISNDIIGDLDRHACYSEDGKRLESISVGAGRDERWPSLIPRQGTEIICDRAYDDNRNRRIESRILEIPNSVFAIGNAAFEYLECGQIILPKSLKYITGNPLAGKYTQIVSMSPYFKVENKALLTSNEALLVANLDDNNTTICVPEKIEIIGRGAFSSNKKLEHLIIPKSVIALSDLFIQDCENLRIIEFMGAVQLADKYSFNGCRNLKAVIVPDQYFDFYKHFLPEEFESRLQPKSSIVDVEMTIEQIAIEDDKRKSLSMQKEDYDIHPSADDLNLIKRYKDKCKKTFIQESEWQDATIDWGAHENEEHESWEWGDAKYSKDGTRLLRHSSSEDETYTVKNGTKVICDYAFGDSSNIENVIIPGSVTCLGDRVFYYPGPKRFRIPKSIRTITGNTFVKCSVDLSCDSSYFTIEEKGLYDKDKQILISIYNSDKYVDKVNINQNIRIIGRNAFHGMFIDGNSPFVIPDGVIYIADEAFRDTIFQITLPSQLIEIGDSAFEHSYLKIVNIPDSVQKIGQKAFYWCERLTEVKLPKQIKTIEKETFSSCKELTKVYIPEGCKAIKEMAFWSCYKLGDVYLPNSLEIIEKNAFGNGHLTSIVISRRTKIDKEAFPTDCKIIYRD